MFSPSFSLYLSLSFSTIPLDFGVGVGLGKTNANIKQYVNLMIAHAGLGSFKGKTVAISGSGNVAQYAAIKALELGATVVSLSDSKGTLLAAEGSSFSPEDVHAIAALKV